MGEIRGDAGGWARVKSGCNFPILPFLRRLPHHPHLLEPLLSTADVTTNATARTTASTERPARRWSCACRSFAASRQAVTSWVVHDLGGPLGKGGIGRLLLTSDGRYSLPSTTVPPTAAITESLLPFFLSANGAPQTP